MGGSYQQQPSPAPQTTAEMLQAYNKYLPQLTSTMDAAIGPTAQAEQAAQTGTAGESNALNLAQLQQFAMPEAQVGQQVANSNALAGANTNLAQLNGPGGAAASAAEGVNRATNPDYYAAQDAASKGAASAIGAVNLNGLSPGEQAATERSLNQNNVGTGNLGLLNPENTISNAMNFGGAFNNKIGIMNSAVGAATGAANSASNNGGFNGVNVALGQPNTSTAGNFGTSQFGTSTPTTGAGAAGNVFNFGSGLLNNMTSANNSATGANAQLGSSAMSSYSPTAYLASTCCFIFLEAYHGTLPAFIRKGRDKYYEKDINIATGYRRMANWLVPLMQENVLIRSLVWHLMINPITQHLGFIHKKKDYKKSRFVMHFWIKLWAMTGKNKSYSDYDMVWAYSRRTV